MRYLPLTDADRREMLAAIGVPSVDALFVDVPAVARHELSFDLPPHQAPIGIMCRPLSINSCYAASS
jgi:glycine dehydrogenase subunit 1